MNNTLSERSTNNSTPWGFIFYGVSSHCGHYWDCSDDMLHFRQLQETPTADQFYTRYDNSHFFLPIPREQTIYLAGGRLSKLFPERRIVFLVAFRPELRYASIELDNIYYSHNLSSPFSWYHFDVNYVADDLQSRNDLNSRLIDLCSKNKCLGPSIDTLKLWRDKRAALMTQLQKLLMDKRVLLGTAKENLQEVEAVATAYSSVSVLFSNSAAVTLSKKTFSSAALDLSAEMGVTLRHSNMFKDLSITGDTVKQTSKLCELDGNQTATVDAGEPAGGSYFFSLLKKTTLVGKNCTHYFNQLQFMCLCAGTQRTSCGTNSQNKIF